MIVNGYCGNSIDCQKAEVLFRPLALWVAAAAREAGIEEVCIAEDDAAALINKEVKVLKGAEEGFCSFRDFISENLEGNVLVLPGDAPFITAECISKALELHLEKGNDLTGICTVDFPGETEPGEEVKIEFEFDFAGFKAGYWMKAEAFLAGVDKLFSTGEGRLSDMLTTCHDKWENVGDFFANDMILNVRVRDFRELKTANDFAKLMVLDKLMECGVEVVCDDGVLICPDATIGKGTKILPGTIVKGSCTVGENCVIGPNTLIEDSVVGNEVVLNSVQCYKSRIEDEVSVGPFVHIRPGSVICKGVKIGDFVEVKNSVVGAGTKIAHLTYVGDSDVGENVNFGCGCVTVNYDGIKKARCTIGNNVFLGCNTNLVAPVTLEDDSYTAAGSTITHNVPKGALAIARARQVNIEGWVERRRNRAEKEKK